MPAENAVCARCGRLATIRPTYTAAAYCPEHFRQLIEKRVRKDLRTHMPLDVAKGYAFEDDGAPLARLTREFLGSIFGERLSLAGGDGRILVACLEQEASALFGRFLDPTRDPPSGIRPLRSVSVEDVNHLLPEAPLKQEEFLHPLLAAVLTVEPTALFGIMNVLEKE